MVDQFYQFVGADVSVAGFSFLVNWAFCSVVNV